VAYGTRTLNSTSAKRVYETYVNIFKNFLFYYFLSPRELEMLEKRIVPFPALNLVGGKNKFLYKIFSQKLRD